MITASPDNSKHKLTWGHIVGQLLSNGCK